MKRTLRLNLKPVLAKTALLALLIVVSGYAKAQCNASFNYTTGANGIVNFASTSINAPANTIYYWNFGDGSNGYGQNASHAYTANGTFWVSLTIYDTLASCNSSVTDSIYVFTADTTCPSTISFMMLKDSSQALTWNAYPNYPANATSVTWIWGDGTSTSSFYPSHTYASAGNYPICMMVTLSCGMIDTFCLNQYIYRSSGASDNMLTVNVLEAAGNATGIKNNGANKPVAATIYPNPASDRASLIINSATVATYNLEVYNVAGVLILSEKVNTEPGQTNSNLNIASLPSGLYFISLSSGTSHTTLKLIKD